MISAERIRNSVVSGIEAVTSKKVEIGDNDNFADYDIDSLDSMSLMMEVEELLGLEFKEIDPKDLSTPADYIRLIQSMENGAANGAEEPADGSSRRIDGPESPTSHGLHTSTSKEAPQRAD